MHSGKLPETIASMVNFLVHSLQDGGNRAWLKLMKFKIIIPEINGTHKMQYN